MPSNKKATLLSNIFKPTQVCCCDKSDICEPKPKQKQEAKTSEASLTRGLVSDTGETNPLFSRLVSPCPKISDSVAVVKDSDDPYLDFRQSMCHMILEREIDSMEELQELLNCFLEVNSPIHHEIILRAFTEIWNGVISTSSHE